MSQRSNDRARGEPGDEAINMLDYFLTQNFHTFKSYTSLTISGVTKNTENHYSISLVTPLIIVILASEFNNSFSV